MNLCNYWQFSQFRHSSSFWQSWQFFIFDNFHTFYNLTILTMPRDLKNSCISKYFGMSKNIWDLKNPGDPKFPRDHVDNVEILDNVDNVVYVDNVANIANVDNVENVEHVDNVYNCLMTNQAGSKVLSIQIKNCQIYGALCSKRIGIAKISKLILLFKTSSDPVYPHGWTLNHD